MSRTGYRLTGARVPIRLRADIASEPACLGAVQLPPEGEPIVLMADHPTIGGYPIVGVVPAHGVARLAQRGPDAAVRFAPESIETSRVKRRRLRAALSSWVSAG
jgi:allophanate hydrolase subunit 2